MGHTLTPGRAESWMRMQISHFLQSLGYRTKIFLLSSFLHTSSSPPLPESLTQRISGLLSLPSPYYMPISCTKWYKKVSNAITLVRRF